MKRVINIILCMALIITAAFGFSGCGTDSTSASGDVTSFTLKEDGSVEHCIVGDFSESYSKNELEEYIDSEIEQYNADSEDPKVSLDSLSVSDGKVKIIMNYASVYDYATFNSVSTYYGTVEGAINAGFLFDQDFDYQGISSVKGYTIPAEYPWLNILIVEEPMEISLPSSAIFVSDSIERNESGTYTVNADYDSAMPEIFQTVNQTFSYLIY